MSFFFGTTGDAGASPPPPPPPVWLPQAPSGDYPVAYGSPKDDRYWYDAAEGTAAGFFASVSKIVGGVGLVLIGSDPGVTLIGAARAAGNASSVTVVVNFNSDTRLLMTANTTDDGQELYFVGFSGPNPTGVYTQTGGYDLSDSWSLGDHTTTPYIPSTNSRIAFTVTPTDQAESVDGLAAITGANVVAPASTEVVIGGFDDVTPPGGTVTLIDVAFYAPQPNTDLPTLSGA